MDLESQSEANPPREKRSKVVLYINADALALLEEYRLLEMGMARKYKTHGQALEELLTKNQRQLKATDYWKTTVQSYIDKGRKIMARRIERLSKAIE